MPIEFYKTCWNLISESFIECAQESFKYGEMSNSQRKAVITLIEKQGKDRTLIENWRPISLINVDAKIISKVIAVRVENVLPNIINHNQTGHVKDRYFATSDYFTLARGVRQGDPLSPYLFLLVIETLAISIRKNPEIDGIKIGNNETKILQ